MTKKAIDYCNAFHRTYFWSRGNWETDSRPQSSPLSATKAYNAAFSLE